MLSEEACMSLTKTQAWEIYKQLYENLDKKEKLIDNYVTMVYNKLSSEVSGVSTSLPTTRETKQVEPELVREYGLIDLPDNCTNLFLGSSIITKLQTDNTIPSDIAIHPYRGSTTKEKLAIVEKYSKRKMRSVVLQDGTNSF